MALVTSDVTIAENRRSSSSSFLTVEAGASERRILLYAPPPDTGTTIESAHLLLRQYETVASETRNLTVQAITEAWNVNRVAWGDQPPVGGATATAAVTGAGSKGRLVDIDVTTIVQAAAASGQWFGLRIISDASRIRFFAADSSKYKPELVIVASKIPPAPVVSPSAGRAVSVARPYLSVALPSNVTGFQVQVHSTTDFTTPDIDSGIVPVSNGAAIGFFQMPSDVTLGSTLYQRGRLENGSGLGEWSEPRPFTRADLDVPTILFPADAPNNVVSDTTPPLAHSVAGVQTSLQYLITDAAGVVLWDSLRQGGAAGTLTPQSPLPLVEGPTYTFEVRTTDDVPREATLGDPGYASATRDFTFALSASVDPVFDLVSSQPDERPHRLLSFKSTSAPDGLKVLRRLWTADGSEPWDTLASVDAIDLFVGGTTYEYMDREVPPQGKYEWMVQRVVNNETSANNPITSGKVECVGVWISTLDGEAITCLADCDPQWSPDETVEHFRPFGGDRVHTVTHARRGYKSDLEGYVVATETRTFAENAAAWKVLADPTLSPYGTTVMILSYSNRCVRFTWAGVADDPRGEFWDHHRVSVEELFQVPREPA